MANKCTIKSTATTFSISILNHVCCDYSSNLAITKILKDALIVMKIALALR
jgi:hypothetical protein